MYVPEHRDDNALPSAANSLRPWSVSDYGQWYDPDWSLAVTLGNIVTLGMTDWLRGHSPG